MRTFSCLTIALTTLPVILSAVAGGITFSDIMSNVCAMADARFGPSSDQAIVSSQYDQTPRSLNGFPRTSLGETPEQKFAREYALANLRSPMSRSCTS